MIRRDLLVKLLLASMILLVLTGCQPFQRQERIVSHPRTYDTAAPSVQELIAQGRVRRGMNREQVHLSLGVPEAIEREVGSHDLREEWAYRRRFEAGYTLFFRRGLLYHIRRDIEEKPSSGAVTARNRLLESLPLDDVEATADAFKSTEEAGSVAGSIARQTTTGAVAPAMEQRVTLLPHFAAWAEARNKIEENRKLRSGLARYATFSEVGSYIESVTPTQLVLRERTDEEGRFLFDQVPPGEWMLTADYNDEDGLHVWWVAVSVPPGGQVSLTLSDENLAASYLVP